jgi:anaerobic selenocysteine-containing dehydrogenase
LAPEPILADIPRLQKSLESEPDGFLLIGRRHLRSNNSWMHNLPALAGGTNRCTLLIHPDDAARLGVTDTAVVTGPGGKLEVPVEITDAIRPGVVSLPHGWGHTAPGTRLSVAAAQPGVNVNSLLDSSLLEPLSGTSVLNGVPVQVMAPTAQRTV